MKPFLPLQDPEPDQRRASLQQQRDAYQYDYDFLPPLALSKDVPKGESFSPKYISERAFDTSELIPNMLAVRARAFLDPLDTLQDYEDFFPIIPLPPVAKTYQTDQSFAEQRLSGANPLVIRKLLQIPQALNDLQTVSQNDLANGTIYTADYTGEADYYQGPSRVKGGTYEKGRKYLPKARAFFKWKKAGVSDRGKLVPIAIEFLDDPHQNTSGNQTKKVFTPFDTPNDWLFAKFCIQVADANHHEMNSHLCRTHFVMEPIVVGTARQLAENHPLSLLLKPHFRFILTNNELGRERLINPGGPVDQLLAGELEESMELVKDAYTNWDIQKLSFPEDIKNRGMNDINSLPHYPYRDDGQLLWEAISNFVANYLKFFYPNAQALQSDQELQAWAEELSNGKTQGGGKVKGMPNSFNDLQELIAIITTIIFTCGPLHSAVNYTQYEYMAFAANMPLAAYTQSPQTDVEEEDILRLLPPFQKTAGQLQSLYFLAAYRFDRLGYYDRTFNDLYGKSFDEVFDGTPITGYLAQFQQDLNLAEQRIDQRNRSRIVPYPFLKPSLVLNSISI